MAYITREDGERFVIPSYRDVLSGKKASLLRKEILLLASNYGEYIALQRKGLEQYEVAYSPDPGYLLGETVWHYFKRPLDLIYCEAIPNTSEAILVIVKSGSVYLDGTFPMDAIPDELVIFRTQYNSFEIYLYGDVPISKTPEEGKFAFDSSSVKSFTVLERPVFPLLPLVKAFQLQLVDTALREKRIGTFPVRNVLIGLGSVLFLWLGYYYLSTHREQIPEVIIRATDPYQFYYNVLQSPDPADQIRWLSSNVWLLSTIPGWTPDTMDFANNVLVASVRSRGARTNLLFEWGLQNHALVQVTATGFSVRINTSFPPRPRPNKIYNLDKVVAVLTDSLSFVVPGNNLEVSELTNRGRFFERQLVINFSNITATTLDLIGRQLENLPLILTRVTLKETNGTISGSINLRALGN